LGPDPVLSVPTDLVAMPGTTVVVPVNIDTAKPEGSTGLVGATLALTFDPKVFDVSAADVHLGTVPEGSSGWQVRAEVNEQTGQIGVWLFSGTAIQSTMGGSLVTIAMHVRDTAPAGATGLTIVPWVNPTGGVRPYQTALADAQSHLVLHTAETPFGTEPGAPGLVTIGQLAFVEGARVPQSLATQITDVAAITTAVNALPMAVVEQVFSGLEQAAQLAQDSAMVQPGAILTTESSEQGDHGVRDLALLQASAGAGQTAEWLPEDMLAYLGHAKGRRLLDADDQLTDAADGEDLTGLEAYFAREAGAFRLP
jgi:hypothetical protein